MIVFSNLLQQNNEVLSLEQLLKLIEKLGLNSEKEKPLFDDDFKIDEILGDQ